MIAKQWSVPAVRRGIGLAAILALASVAVFSVMWIKLPVGSKSPATVPSDSPSETTSAANKPSERDARKISFNRSGSVYVHDLKSGEEKLALEKLGFGLWSDGNERQLNYSHSISLDGEAIAYTYASAPLTSDSTIKVRNLVSGAIREFPELNGTDSSEPVWSHDGKQIAFTLFKSIREWHIGILDLTSGKWRDITTAPELDQEVGVWFDSWMPDDKSIVCHSSQFLYRLGLDGRVLLKLPIESFLNGDTASSRTRFSFTAEGSRLLFDSVDTDDAALFIYDFDTKSLSRVTPTTIGAMEPRWLPGEKEILFTCFDANQKPKVYNICKIAVDGSGLNKLIENARFASYSTN